MTDDIILRGLVLDKQARIAIIDTSDILCYATKVHNLVPVAQNAMGRALTIGAYISYNMKNELGRFNVIIDGGGPLGKIYVAGENLGKIKGYIENSDKPKLKQYSSEKLKDAVGHKGFFTVIKDMGLKEPYVGRTELASGNISDDFAFYLFSSEGIRCAVGLDVFTYQNRLCSYGIICEAMPGVSDEAIFILEDIMSRFREICLKIANLGVEEAFNYYFKHFGAESLSIDKLEYFCNCESRGEEIIKSIGENEISDILRNKPEVEILCDYCGKHIVYNKDMLEILFNRSF
ncbi:MAG: Hsp33 family molecular chaperone HslO [Clostridia bacterium]|nr:Hsp33 family molecular chaperone HslO [Clostridia bacterium]